MFILNGQQRITLHSIRNEKHMAIHFYILLNFYAIITNKKV